MHKLLELFIGFGRSGILGYGGGPSAIPLVQAEAVDTFHWVTKEEFANILAIGNALPGPIATKMAGYIGYKVAGYLGAAVAVTVTILPTILMMIGLATIFSKFKDNPIIQGMVKGVTPIVFVLLALLAFNYSKFATTSLISIALAVIGVVLLQFFKIHPAIVVFGALLFGGIFLR